MTRMHGAAAVAAQIPAPGQAGSGRFGRMFPTLPALVVDGAKLDALAATMVEPAETPDRDNRNVPAGFTYLGQFVDHDITLDTAATGERLNDAEGRVNFRTPRLDLDSLYGAGPDGSPHLYDRLVPGRLAVGSCGPGGGGDATVKAGLPNDLARNADGIALIGDPRNDENLLVAQTHLAFIKFHNHVLATVAGGDFARAREIVTWHYQWILLHDFLARLVDFNEVHDVLTNGRRFYRFETQGVGGEAFMPVEFAGAAYRLGHSMVREVYSHNRAFREGAAPSTFAFLFHFSGKSGGIVGRLAGGTAAEQAAVVAQLKLPKLKLAPGPGAPEIDPFLLPFLPGDWAIDWHRFFELGQPKPPPNGAKPADNGFVFNFARKLDPLLAPALHDLPGGGGSLPARNLRRGVALGLPSGQAVAQAMGYAVLAEAEIAASGADGAKAHALGLAAHTPLWYYILKEAQLKGDGGNRLGPVGSRILAEVFIGLLQGDATSFLRKAPGWTPTLPGAHAGRFTMADMLRLVGDLDPINEPSSH